MPLWMIFATQSLRINLTSVLGQVSGKQTVWDAIWLGGALRNNACEGGKEAGRGRERSQTVLQSQQGAQLVSMGVLLSWVPCRVAVLQSRESVLYIHTGPDLVLGLPLREGGPGLPSSSSGKEHACPCRRHKRCRFNPWVGKIPWMKAWQSTPVLSPGESHGERNLWATVHKVTKSRTELSDLSHMCA